MCVLRLHPGLSFLIAYYRFTSFLPEIFRIYLYSLPFNF